MSDFSPSGRFRALVAVLSVVFMAAAITGCNTGSQATPVAPIVAQEEDAACWPTYGSEVEAAAISADGNRVLFLSGQKPAKWPDDRGWSSSDKALYVLDFTATGSQQRYIAISWDAIDQIDQYATARANTPERPVKLEEDMVDLWLSKTGDRFVVAVARKGVGGRYAKLYSGTVPAGGFHELRPGEGLEQVLVNNYAATEGIRTAALSDDGSMVAAVVGSRGEVRVYDLDSQQPTVYALNEGGETVVEHELPPPPVDLDSAPNPAIAGSGTMLLTWSPGGDRLALARDEDVPGQKSLSIIDVATGKVALVRRFDSSTVPHVAWAADGQSLFVMNTLLEPGQIFGDTEIRRLAAEEDGREVSDGGALERPRGYRTEPAYLTGFGDDDHFLFVWETGLYRLNTPAGDPSKASYIQLTPDDYDVLYSRPTVSSGQQRAVFVAHEGSRLFVGERTEVLADECPYVVVPPTDATAAAPDAATGSEDSAGEPTAEVTAESGG